MNRHDEQGSVSRRELLKLFRQETKGRMERVLEELTRGPAGCDYSRVYQEFDSMQGGARATDLAWQERNGRLLAAYTGFLQNLGPGAVPESSHALLTEVVGELHRQCDRLTLEEMLEGAEPIGRIPDLLQDLERNMDAALEHGSCPTHPKVLLIVDDSATSRMLFRVHLPQAEQYQIHEAEDLHSALSSARAVRPDLVLMDYNMPEMDGIAIARQMQEEGLGRCFVLITANVQQAVLDAARAAGFRGVLEKPVSADKIAKLLKDIAG